MNATNELSRFIDRFGLATSLYLDGPEVVCPICQGDIDQPALTLELTGIDELACNDCGAVLAA